MKIKQLGNGGGLNPLMTNSSFLIDLYDDESEYLLFDCGFNIMVRLIEEEKDTTNYFHISKIKHVFISHDDDDHIGNLQTLIYWNFFKNNTIMTTITQNNTVINSLKSINKTMVGGQMAFTRLYHLSNCDLHEFDNKIKLIHTPAFHGNRECTGMLIYVEHGEKPNRYSKEGIFISGDTKANEAIEVLLSKEEVNLNKTLIFHDYSHWNAPSKNVHACEGDFTVEYSKEFQYKCIKYHTGKDVFNKEWLEVK